MRPIGFRHQRLLCPVIDRVKRAGDMRFHSHGIDTLFRAFAVGQVRSGKIRALAATSAQRISALPEVPTMQEAGVSDYVFSPWWGAYLPAGPPQPILDKVSAWMNQMARAPESAKFLETMVALPVLDNPPQMAERLRKDRGMWDRLAAAANLQPN